MRIRKTRTARCASDSGEKRATHDLPERTHTDIAQMNPSRIPPSSGAAPQRLDDAIQRGGAQTDRRSQPHVTSVAPDARLQDLSNLAATPRPRLAAPKVSHSHHGASIGEVDRDDTRMRDKLVAFLNTMDDQSMAERFGDDFIPDKMFDPRDFDSLIVATHGSEIAGFIDHSESDFHGPGVAQINILVSSRFRGTGIAKDLARKQDEMLLKKGYTHKFGFVYSNNPEQLARLQNAGWKRDENASDEDTIGMWMAIDPRYKDVPPSPVE